MDCVVGVAIFSSKYHFSKNVIARVVIDHVNTFLLCPLVSITILALKFLYEKAHLIPYPLSICLKRFRGRILNGASEIIIFLCGLRLGHSTG